MHDKDVVFPPRLSRPRVEAVAPLCREHALCSRRNVSGGWLRQGPSLIYSRKEPMPLQQLLLLFLVLVLLLVFLFSLLCAPKCGRFCWFVHLVDAF